ncbi:glutamine amidotransferase-related protein [Jannaschia sp. LMIT008]|uniref:glutamine amidotransferase-related protein n=1 Tax=Jannaschia maritima TaxID=3032585 RepID=UPI0028116104|nr:gamma-glutamyl-gamma-aminobutyrate hydrolase family protein [Jannaschia sp. LMIT008]
MRPGLRLTDVNCVEGTPPPALSGYDGAVFAGSPIQMHENAPEVRSAARFMEAVYEAGLPSFGSCAGLQIAVVAAGGSVRPRSETMEAAFARGVWRTPDGADHPLLADRPGAWDAPAMHASMVDLMPDGGTVLARTRATPVQAAEIRRGAGTFWGVQYHPELSLAEIAAALRASADDLVGQGLAGDAGDVGRYADVLDGLDADPDRRDLAFRLGLDEQTTRADDRRREIENFLRMLGG